MTTTTESTPEVVLQLGSTGASTLTVAGDKPQPLSGDTVDDARNAGIHYVLQRAAGLNRPVQFDAHDPDGHWRLVAHPDGQITEHRPQAPTGSTRPQAAATAPPRPGAADRPAGALSADQAANTSRTGSHPPEARIVHRMDHMTVHLDASLSTDLDGGLVEFSWDFGDGTSGSGVEAAHTYAAGGQYKVTLRVVSRSGLGSRPRVRRRARTRARCCRVPPARWRRWRRAPGRRGSLSRSGRGQHPEGRRCGRGWWGRTR